MDWKEEMEMGMLMIQSACQKNTEWEKCHECPFQELCDYISQFFTYPDGWDVKKKLF